MPKHQRSSLAPSLAATPSRELTRGLLSAAQPAPSALRALPAASSVALVEAAMAAVLAALLLLLQLAVLLRACTSALRMGGRGRPYQAQEAAAESASAAAPAPPLRPLAPASCSLPRKWWLMLARQALPLVLRQARSEKTLLSTAQEESTLGSHCRVAALVRGRLAELFTPKEAQA
jgi:hypothetical protein